jgi:para-nitrobenzyl esterase
VPLDPTTSEDCLRVNVWAPDGIADRALPVIVWLHGGGFWRGSGSEYRGEALVPDANVVLVTVNYRLGPLGFLVHPALAAEHPNETSGNYGFLDQRFALRWVKDNIFAFGGDPDNVVLAGQSAGGISVCMHLVAPESEGLFHAAIVQSGASTLIQSVEKGAAQGRELEQLVGCVEASDTSACSRAADTALVVAALPPPHPLGLPGTTWGPVADGVTIPVSPIEAFQNDRFAHVPMLLGTNRDEGTFFVNLTGLLDIDRATYEDTLSVLAPTLGTDEATLAEMYPVDDYPKPAWALAAAFAEAKLNCPARRIARVVANAGAGTFLYHFEEAAADSPLGASHGAELPFLFTASFQATQEPLALAMRAFWGRFAENHDPNQPGATPWPPYDGVSDEHLALSAAAVATGSGLRREHCDFWDRIPTP